MANPRRNYMVIDGNPYALVRDVKERRRSFSRTTVFEPPYDEAGPPLEQRHDWDSWHLGSGDSRQLLYGRTEYGQNSDARFVNTLLPGPAITTITLTGSAATPVAFFEALGRLFVCAGRRLFRINPADDSVVESRDAGAANVYRSGIAWEGVAVATTDETAGGSMRSLAALASPDVWSAASATPAWLLARETKRLYGVSRTGGLRNLASGLGIGSTSWTDPVQAGESTEQPEGLVAWNQSVFVGKPDGFFGFDADGEAVDILPELKPQKHASNGFNMAAWHSSILVPWRRGLFRYYHPRYEAAGLERLPLNRSAVRGRWWDFAGEGLWIYAVMQVSTHTYIKVGRDKTQGETGFGPIIWDDLLYLASTTCQAIHVSSLWDPPRLFFGHGNNVGYVTLSTDFGAADVWGSDWVFSTAAAGGSRYLPSVDLGSPGLSKYWRKVEIITEDCTAANYWQIYGSVDGAARVQIGANITTNGRVERFWPVNTTGRRMQISVDWVNTSATTPPKITGIAVFGAVVAQTIPAIRVLLDLRSGLHIGNTQVRDSAETQRSRLQTLAESAPVTIVDVYGNTLTGRIRRATVTESEQEGSDDAAFVAEVLIQVMENT